MLKKLCTFDALEKVNILMHIIKLHYNKFYTINIV